VTIRLAQPLGQARAAFFPPLTEVNFRTIGEKDDWLAN
jgi:hypothetical protein